MAHNNFIRLEKAVYIYDGELYQDENGNVDLALKKFKAKFARSGVPSELKKRKCYEKPGVKRRNEKKENIKNSRRRNHN